MHRQSKWFTVPSLQDSTAIVARRCLANRLRWMWGMLRAAARNGPKNQTAVHQLRVATRRASTALAVFHDELTATPELAWLEKQLKKLRRAAAAARDYDVLAAGYRAADPQRRAAEPSATATDATDDSRAIPPPDHLPKKLLGELESRRAAAREPLCKLAKKLRQMEFPRHINRMLADLRKLARHDRKPTEFGLFARQAFRHGWRGYRAAAESEPRTIDELHELRIRTKALRYSLELLAAAFSPEFREQLYPRIVELQERLGALNDHAVALKYLGLLQSELAGKKSLAWLAGEIPRRQAAVVESQRVFLAWWKGERTAFLGLGERLIAAKTTATLTPTTTSTVPLAEPHVAGETTIPVVGVTAREPAIRSFAKPSSHATPSLVDAATTGVISASELPQVNAKVPIFLSGTVDAPLPGTMHEASRAD